MKVGILGSGDVARHLAAGFLKYGHAVTVGSRDPKKLADWGKEHPKAKLATFDGAAVAGELLVVAVKGPVVADALRLAGAKNLAGKVVIDVNNPVADKPPVDGVLQLFTGPNQSLMENLQKEFADARFVKAFSCVGAELMVDPKLKGGPPTMFICGNDAAAKKAVTEILTQFGWETNDMGTAIAARAIEPLCLLWCLPGFTKNEWTHAFKMLR